MYLYILAVVTIAPPLSPPQVREVNGTFYDFDSLLQAPRKLHPESEVYKYLTESVIETSGAEMLCVYPLKSVSPIRSPTYESARS